MEFNDHLRHSLDRLIDYIESNNYRGYDPYDALKSPLFKLPVLKSNKLIRFGSQQFVKRFPLNLRKLLFIPLEYNPVSLGICAEAYAYKAKLKSANTDDYVTKINFLINELVKLIPTGYKGACWGYDFDWEARYARIPAYQPTLVATGFISNSMYHVYQLNEIEKARDLCISAAEFVLNDLNRTYKDDNYCFSYSPFDSEMVFNASMKGVRLLSQVFHLTGQEEYRTEAKRAVQFVVNHQREDGSWPYSIQNTGQWVDNYHTAYILDCLDDYSKLCDDDCYSDNLSRGLDYYLNHFFTDDGMAKFYDTKIFPIDTTSAAQAIITLIRFNQLKMAMQVAQWMIKNMQGSAGNFFYRRYKRYTIKTSFMRWSQAWIMLAFAKLLYKYK